MGFFYIVPLMLTPATPVDPDPDGIIEQAYPSIA